MYFNGLSTLLTFFGVIVATGLHGMCVLHRSMRLVKRPRVSNFRALASRIFWTFLPSFRCEAILGAVGSCANLPSLLQVLSDLSVGLFVSILSCHEVSHTFWRLYVLALYHVRTCLLNFGKLPSMDLLHLTHDHRVRLPFQPLRRQTC